MRQLFAVLMMLMVGPTIHATHIVGGEIYYDCLGGDNYRITVKVYRDCGPANVNNTQFDNPLRLSIYPTLSTGTFPQVVSISLPPVNYVPLNNSNPCLTPPPQCIEVAAYETVVHLDPIPGGYTLVYQRCCRNSSIQNLMNPSEAGGTYYATIPGPEVVNCNSSPRFSALPPLVICANNLFQFDHSATDPDGDSLVYSFYTPYEGGSTWNPAPNPSDPPPYVPLTWAPGFDVNHQILGTPDLTLNAISGMLTCKPNILGIYVYAIKVKEYRDGVLLSEVQREFQINVVDCGDVRADINPQLAIQLCSGLTLQFTNNSDNATSYLWNFGDLTTTADTSILVNPQYTYPDTGIYMVTLIASPYTPCADTTVEPFYVHLPLSVHYDRPAAQCVTTNSFDLLATGQFTTNAQVDWVALGAEVPVLAGNPVHGITYPDSGYYPVTVTVQDFGCTESYTDTLYVYPVPVIGFSYPQQLACQPYTITFSDTTLSWSPVSYLWDFGDGETSTLAHPTHTYADTGVYDITLTIEVDTVCITTQTLVVPGAIHVFPSPFAQVYVTTQMQSILTPVVGVQDMAQGHIDQVIYFDDGAYTSLAYAEHYYQDTGVFNITQWVINEFGCTDTAVNPVYIKPNTSVYVPNAFTPNGDGLNEIFLPLVRDVRSYEAWIFNRWGEIIWYTTDPLSGWDGRSKGKLMQQDVYVYKIKYTDQMRIEHEEYGHFTLLR